MSAPGMPLDFSAVLRSAYEDSLDGIVIADPQTIILDCNEAYARLTGYARAELIGQRTNIVRSGVTPRRVFQDMWAKLSGEGRWVGELVNRRKDGSLWISFLSITRVNGPDDRPLAYVGIARDLSSLRRLEGELRSSAGRLAALLDSTEEGILMFDQEGVCVLVNRHAARQLGVPAEVLVQQPAGSLATVAGRLFREPEALGWHDYGQLDARATWTRTLLTRSDPPQVLRCFTAPVRGADGEPLGRLFALRDVTREAEADRMKSEFISTVSHELRTPMTSIKGALGLVLGGAAGELNPELRELLTIAQNNTDRLVRLVNDILDISRIEAGRMELRLAPARIEDLIDAAVAELRPFAQQRSVALEVETRPDLPEVQVDADRVQQVLTNLLSNAIKFTDPGGRVVVGAMRIGARVAVEVRDTGIGVPRDQLMAIFEKFHRVDNAASRRSGGTGLGLAISRAIVREHGGQIWAESEPGRGSRFVFTLPLRSGEPPSRRSQPRPPARGSGAGAAPPGSPGEHRPVVLVCDDDDDVRELLCRALQREGMDAVPAATGEEALRLAREQPVDAVALDLVLPDLDGLDVARRLREDPATHRLPIVVISAYSAGREPELLAVGVASVLRKPVEPTALIAAIREALGRSEQRGQPSILAVDDDVDTRHVIARVLERAGYRVRTAAGGEEAFRLIREELPDLLVLDLLMPGMDGFELIRRLQAEGTARDLPLIVLTALDLSEAERRALHLGPTYHMTKSRRMADEIVARVRDLLPR